MKNEGPTETAQSVKYLSYALEGLSFQSLEPTFKTKQNILGL